MGAIESGKNTPTEVVGMLNGLKGRTIVGLIRVIRWSPDKITNVLRIKEDQIFGLGFGPIFLLLDNLDVIGVDGLPIKQSVTIWKEDVDNYAELWVSLLKKYSGESVINSSDPVYSVSKWDKFIGQKIETISIIKVSGDRRTNRQFANERGIIIGTDRGDELILSFMLASKFPADLVLINREDVDRGVDIEHVNV